MNLIGIIQGRLSKAPKTKLQSFPKKIEEEFKFARKINLNFIEFFSERVFNKNNPIWSLDGILKYKYLSKKYNLDVYTFCDDYIISNNIQDKKTLIYLKKLINNLHELGCKRLVLPFYGKSILNADNLLNMSLFINRILKVLKKKKINLLIETNLSPRDYFVLKKKLTYKNFKLVFDTGNRVINNTQLDNEIKLFKNDIGHVHIKDKNDAKKNVKLGTGLVNFRKVFQSLKYINYNKAFTIESIRGDNPILMAKKNLNFIKKFL